MARGRASGYPGQRAAILAASARLPLLILRFVEVYVGAQDAHRVLTEDVRFLDAPRRARIRDIERDVVAGFAGAIAALRPQLATRARPLAMLLFEMINWLFTWFRPAGALDHAALAQLVAELFLRGALNLGPD